MSGHAAAGAGLRPWPTLTPLGPQGKVRPIRVGRAVCLVGSHSRVHLPLRSPMVSRIHAMIICDAHEAYIRDLASRNGVFVSGTRTREGRLRSGDIVCIGSFAFRWAITWGSPQLKAIAPAPMHKDLILGATDGSAPRRFACRTVLIGSRDECDLLLQGSFVEPVHAVIYRRGSKHFLRDLNSKSGTYVNSRRVRETELREADEIRVGLTFLRVGGDEAEPVETAALNHNALLTGFAGMLTADHPLRRAPTIEELLGEMPNSGGIGSSIASGLGESLLLGDRPLDDRR